MSVLSRAVAQELEKRAKRAARKSEKRAMDQVASGPAEDVVGEVAERGTEAKADPLEADAAEAGVEVESVPSMDEIEEILKANNIPTSASLAIPVPLRATRIHFSGIKSLPATHPEAAGYDPIEPAPARVTDDHGASDGQLELGLADAGEAEKDAARYVSLAAVPFSWEWAPQVGVNGIGSGRNLRGKSTVLNVLMWALSGRCANFQVDVKSWIKHVEVDWQVGTETLLVEFENDDGRPIGSVKVVDGSGDARRDRVVGAFDGEDQFEGVMGSVMMSRLRLEEIPVWTVDREVRHKWPAYASAFTVRADTLDPVVGNVTSLGIRMLQMFVGTNWGPALAATQTALGELNSDRATAEQKASHAGEVISEQRAKAQVEVDRLDAAVAAIPVGTPDIEQLLAAATRATDLAREVHELERRLMSATAEADTVRLQLRAAQARHHTQYEDALAIKFFHQMTPSVCPRCASAVTPEQQAAEAEKHECSLCSRDLKLDEVDTAKGAAAAIPVDGDFDEPIDDAKALEAALKAASQAVEALTGDIKAKRNQLGAAEAQSTTGQQRLGEAEERRKLELALARAQGALGAFTETTNPEMPYPADPTVAAVLGAADNVLGKWMRERQDPLLKEISTDIETLAIEFGADSLSGIKLGGGGRMDVVKGGEPTTYSGLTAGEKLRVKIATAVALIKHGYVAGVGRHPGFLVLDSPAAEEMPEEDLAILMEALVEVAGQAQMQIFVGTRNAGPLVDLLPEANRRVAVGDAFLW